jgi:hypothetical protein
MVTNSTKVSGYQSQKILDSEISIFGNKKDYRLTCLVENPFFKKCLISQFIPHKIESHTKEYFYKYSPWTYFQCTMTNLEDYRKKRKNIELDNL